MNSRVLVATLCLLWILPGFEGVEGKNLNDAKHVVAGIQARYQKVKDLQAEFTQETKIEGFGTPLFSSGMVYIKKPGKLRWEYHEPSVEKIYVNDDDVQVYVPAHQQVLVGTLTTMTASRAPLQLLQGVGNLEQDFQLDEHSSSDFGAGGLPLVTLLPRPGPAGADPTMAKVVLEAYPKTFFLKSIAIHEISGNVSTFEFTNLKANTSLQDGLFTLEVPEDVEIIEASTLGQ